MTKRIKNKAAVELGRKGGLARKKNLTPEERRESARKAALARWEQERAKREDECEYCGGTGKITSDSYDQDGNHIENTTPCECKLDN